MKPVPWIRTVIRLFAVVMSVNVGRGAVDAPVSPNALPEVGALLRFLDGVSGEYILAGQQEFPGWSDESKDVDFDFLWTTTGRRPVVRGFDYLFYTHSAAGRAGQRTSERAISWSRAGGIVTIAVHLFVDIGSPAGEPQFYTAGGSQKGTTFDIREAVIEGTPENREFLAKLDLLAGELKKLRDARVPVLWRPMHECSGGWFWWGAKGATPFIAAWRLMFDRFTRVHGLTNLIWVYNPTDSTTNLQTWYPGDDVVDVISLDVYPNPGQRPAYATEYQQMKAFRNGRKLVAMSENGTIPDPDQLWAQGAYWAYFCTWNGFENDATRNPADVVNRIFNHAKVLTLEEMRGIYGTRAFTITAHPVPRLAVAGAPLSLGVEAHDNGPLSYQWFKDGQPIAGGTTATYAKVAASATDGGAYTVDVTGANGTLRSIAAPVTVGATNQGRIINLSVLGQAGTGAATLITGFSLAGDATPKRMLLRGAGPALAQFGITTYLANPQLQLNTVPPVVNDDWEANVSGTAMEMANAFALVQAFPWPAGSRDAALVLALPGGSYTTSLSGSGNGSVDGLAIAEIYDAAPDAGSRLVNISARAYVGAGASLAPGFVIARDYRTVLIRAVAGPTLSSFGLAGVLANPRLELYRDGAVIASSDDWSSGTTAVTALQSIASAVQAFPIDPATRDAVLLVTLPPGSYSAQVRSADGGSGVALVEVYEVPE